MDALEELVRDAYSRVAAQPEQPEVPFPTGRLLAEGIGYPPELLDGMPESAVECCCGVSAVGVWADLREDDVVLDLGCGAGLDSFVAADRVARTVGVDFSESMLERARSVGDARTTFHSCEAWHVPYPDASFTAVLMNGILNLNPRRADIVAEVKRLLAPGGRMYGAELVLTNPLEPGQKTMSNWFG